AACHREALARSPEFALAYYNLGNVLLAQGKPAEAAGRYREAIARYRNYRKAGRPDPHEADAHNGLGIALGRPQNWPAPDAGPRPPPPPPGPRPRQGRLRHPRQPGPRPEADGQDRRGDHPLP